MRVAPAPVVTIPRHGRRAPSPGDRQERRDVSARSRTRNTSAHLTAGWSRKSCPHPAAVRKSRAVRKVLADMHVPPALTRWTIRVVLALIVAGAIAWVPSGDDDRTERLRRQLEELHDEAA